MAKLPRRPQEWNDEPAGVPAFAPNRSDDVPSANAGRGGFLSGWQPPSWSLADSGIHAVLGPETIADIDFRESDENEESGGQSRAGPAVSRAVVANGPAPPVIRPGDINARLPEIDAAQGPDHRYYSAAGGTVTDAGWENPKDYRQGYGYRIRVRGDDGLLFTYGHTDPDSAQAHAGDKVTAGQYLGSYGDPTNGRSTGPHTHFEVRDPSHPLQSEYDAYIRNSRAMGAMVNPAPYIDTVMPGGHISSKYGKRTIDGRQEFHPGIDLNRLPGRR